MANSHVLTVSLRSFWSVGVATFYLSNAALADNSYAANNKGYTGTSYARSSKVQNAGQTMYSNSQARAASGTSYASGGGYSGTSYARSSAGVPSSHINSNFSQLSTGSGAPSNRASMLSVMGRGGVPKPTFVRPASSFGTAGVRRPQPGKTASAAQTSASGKSAAANGSSPASPSGISVLSRMRKRRG
ncbi:MAG: hypothetical protein K2W95_33205 [Candidatus Obscuribacterales bacterium]|nr:hypothetical protein [Candidatus Obscuribacterales bacterium]